MMSLATRAATLVLAAVLTACADTPVTGRKQLMLVSEDDAISASAQAYQEVLKKEGGKAQHRSGAQGAGG
jgi:hypothetical protein